MGNMFSSKETKLQKYHRQRQKYVESRLMDNSSLELKAEATSDCDAGCGVEAEGVSKSKDDARKVYQSAFSMDEVDHAASIVDPGEYEFPFENLVFEGGGNKGLAHCGAVKYLEEIGMMVQVKRFAGASAGAMQAALLAVGYKSYEIEEFLGQNLGDVFLDHSWGYLSLLPNLIRGYGWNPGMRIFEWFGTRIKDKTGSADTTFEQLKQQFGKELCVIVTNLNQMSIEYCHPKTTPDMPIRLALRMSMSIPGMFTAKTYTLRGQTDVFVDGGILCNYPIHCFDGWYLSTASGDSFLNRLQPLSDLPRLFDKSNRFGVMNKRTMGFLLYSESERDLLRFDLEKRIGTLLPEKPTVDTKLYISRLKKQKDIEKAARAHSVVVKAVDAFLKVLKKHNLDNNDIIDMAELEGAFKDEEAFPRCQAEILFGKNVDVKQAFEILDQDGNGQIKYSELVSFIEAHGIFMQTRFLGFQRKEVNSFFSFLDALQSTLLTNVKRIYVEDRDIARTVGINTGHVDTSDFDLAKEDRDFVVGRGYNSCRSFLQYHVVENSPDRKKIEEKVRADCDLEVTGATKDETVLLLPEEIRI